MQIARALGELGDFGEATGNRNFWHRVAAQIFQHAASKIAHVDQSVVGQAKQCLDRGFRGLARRRADVAHSFSAGNVDAAVDRVDPGGAGIGFDYPGGAQNRNAADNAQPWVPGLLRHLGPAGYRNFNHHIAAAAMLARHFADLRGDHRAWHRVDRRLARRDRQAGPGDCANACSGCETNTVFGGVWAYFDNNQRRVGHVRVVTGILDDPGCCPARRQPFKRQGKGRLLAAGQRDGHRVGKVPGQQRGVGGFGRSRGAGAGGPASAKLAFRFVGHRVVISCTRHLRHLRRAAVRRKLK